MVCAVKCAKNNQARFFPQFAFDRVELIKTSLARFAT